MDFQYLQNVFLPIILFPQEILLSCLETIKEGFEVEKNTI